MLCAASAPLFAQRTTIPLDGPWQIADSVTSTQPKVFDHVVPVPGLAHSAKPAFQDIDLFDSREHIVNLVRAGTLPKSALVDNAGVPHQKRNYFWYRRTFTIKAPEAVAILRINKAQFGAAAWVNGMAVGEHLPCFTAAYMDISHAIRTGENEVVIRIGAHPGVLPPDVSAGSDFEKVRWTPGVYDDVSVLLSGNPVIETIQVAPHILPKSITVETRIRNYGTQPVRFPVRFSVHSWKQARAIGRASQQVFLASGGETTIRQEIALPEAQLWSPDSPNLYVLETSTGGDSAATRFGVREFRFDTPTRRAYLNGKPIFLRGSNITLHRFFEDPVSGTLPWDDQWLHETLVTLPKRMHWNSFRFCIGPVPEHWLDIADEAGFLIQNEYFVWLSGGWFGETYQIRLADAEIIGEYKEWMRDNWNHASVVLWDANNESKYPNFTTKIIPAVRSLDLSNRPWENSYNAPAGADDPVETHPYLTINLHKGEEGGEPFRLTQLEGWSDSPHRVSVPTGHAEIINEYGWLWLNRNGSGTKLTTDVYPKLLGPRDSPEERVRWNAYLLAGETEFWRAYRHYTGILHFVYLTGCDPEGYTCDNFRDVRKLQLQPGFEDYLANAFAPLGVYLNFWQPTLEPGSESDYTVMLVNDDDVTSQGTLALILEDQNGVTLAKNEQTYVVAPLGQTTMLVHFRVPAGTHANCTFRAVTTPASGKYRQATQSRRWVDVATKAK